MNYPDRCCYVRREPQKNDPRHTLICNLKVAFPLVKGDVVLFLEDDEYYSPNYAAVMERKLEDNEVVGVGRSKYYHISTRGYMRHNNLGHASLAQTAFRSSFLPQIINLLNGDSWLDIRIWSKLNGPLAPVCDATDHNEMERKTIKGQGLVFDDGEDHCLSIGIKGMPGRAGIGIGHNDKIYHQTDSSKAILKQWIGDVDAGYY
jgi:hypothetical protein